ncbi:hypothetical protein [Kitasatospora sp. NPDC056184]|uniref:hypothetical protein n=1 Tax=Kitasatospora sp. NPDC056184 TaxID=3345738 RepID=UPI0035DFE3C9
MEEPEVLLFGGSGWVRIAWPDRSYRALVKTEEREGRRVITELVVRSMDRIDSAALKSLPIGWIEGMVNANADAIGRQTDAATDDRLGSVLTELWAVIAEMTAKPAQDFMGSAAPRAPLQRPDGHHPDLFYRDVAQAYMDVLRTTSAIAPVLAEEAGVPVATVRRWIQEARRRGFLPPARKGRAG